MFEKRLLQSLFSFVCIRSLISIYFWDVRLDNITINISLPQGATKEDIKVFGHGSLLGESDIIDGQNVIFTVPYVLSSSLSKTMSFVSSSISTANSIATSRSSSSSGGGGGAF